MPDGTLGFPGFDVNPMMILHGEQYLEVLCDEIPTRAKIVNSAQGHGHLRQGQGRAHHRGRSPRRDAGKPLFKNVFSIFASGEGGFGGESGPPPGNEAPARTPDKSIAYPTLPHQAIIYRLSGDYNPLHIDPQFAPLGGFESRSSTGSARSATSGAP